ncbi:MAG: glycoside hydrolase family 9 protein [Reichenbachiella sp.]
MNKLFRRMAFLFVSIWLLSSSYVQGQHNYGEALQKSLFFYEAQQSGVLPDWNRVGWRGDATTTDGSDVGHDLNGGWYDAGDHVKFNFPMAYSATVLSWGAIEFEDAYRNAGQLDIIKRNIRYVTDYLIKCHTAPNELYGQVGNGGLDHAWWGSPEVYVPARPSYKIDTANPGSDLASETAAALAAASILFESDDPSYSALLLQHAIELYDFADNYRGEYSNSITDAAGFYRSFSSYQDEIVWGAAWLYRATNDQQYLTKAETEYDNLQREGQSTIIKYKEAFSWDDKAYGSYVLLAQLTGNSKYKADAESNLNYFAGGGTESVPTTPGGLPHLRQWGTLRYANNQALLCLIYSDKVTTDPVIQNRYNTFAKFIADYSLGTNPINRSFMVGYGNNPAYNPHHRGNHGTWTNNSIGDPELPSHILYGALVGGPKNLTDDNFVDDRNEYVANEVACDYNAGFTGVLAKMYDLYGGDPLTNFPIAEVPSRAEIRTFSKFNSNNASGSTVAVLIQNRTAWPARVTDQLSFRYFFDISEGVAAGYGIADYAPELNAVQGNATMTIGTWDATANIYYAEISLTGEQIAPIGDPQFRRDVQLNFRVLNGAPYDVTNDWSAAGLDGGAAFESVNIPVYDNGVLVFGSEPNGGDTPNASFFATPTSGKEPLVVAFDASASTDPNGDAITYSWDFGDGTSGTGSIVNHTYSNIGDNVAVLTVSDGANSDTDTETIEVLNSNDSPIAAITVDQTSGIAPATFAFDGSGSSDPNGDALTYAWSFGDGTTATVVSPSHTYATTGSYSVSLIVSAGSRDSEAATQAIGVTDGSIVVAFSATPQSGTIPLVVNFDAAGSSDPEGGTLSYHWDFGNSETATGSTSSTTYVTAGSFSVVLTTTTGTKTNSTTQIVTVQDISNCGFDTPRSTSLPTFGNATFNNVYVLGDGGPDLSNINDFTINWDAANNGLYQFSVQTSNGVPNWWNDLMPAITQNFNSTEPSLTFSGSGFAGLDGDYWVTEDAGYFVMVSKTGGFTLYLSNDTTAPNCGTVSNTAPVTSAIATPTNGTTPLVVSFTGTASDADGDALTYSWEFGDGNTATTASATNTYATEGTYTAILTVDDGNGGTDSKSITVVVSDEPINTAPDATASATPTSGTAPLLVNFTGSGTDADGDALTYSWDFGDGNSANSMLATNTYTSAGTYTAILTVDDGNGGTDAVSLSITVNTSGGGNNNGSADNIYVQRFLELRDEFYDPANGYFSADGSPNHSIESLIVEAPDHGHESTSELYSYWLWLEVMYGRVSEDWQPVNDVWTAMETMIIPTNADQPTNSSYDPSSPAAYASEFPLPSDYPSPLMPSAPVGEDPVSPDLTATYGDDIYLMHWLLDNDNFYGFGNRGDGVSTPSYINTFQRGEQESVYETVPHPSWESFNWGGSDGFLPLFIEDQTYSEQWRYTSAPDADARAVQAMYWAYQYALEQGTDPASLPLSKATKMGDYLRLSMFDKYFKPMGVQSATTGAGQGYESAHYLMSWYTSWGGSADLTSSWAFRISSSHCHFGYQNPVAAYALTQVDAMKPQSANGVRDWDQSLVRQLEFYTWLQAPNGAIAGGATNSWNGDYSTYPAGTSTFYDMAFDTNPVYHDPGSGTWFGWQAWSMERIAEYYYITNDPTAKTLMDKWAAWVVSEVQLIGDNDFEIPGSMTWTGQPDNWNAASPGTNSGLSVTVDSYSKDLGIAASMAKALTYYAAATEKYGTLDVASRDMAQEVLDRMWMTYRDNKGVAAPESRGDFSRIFEEEVYVPEGFTGVMSNGDSIKPGIKFIDIRSDLRNDPDFAAVEAAYNSGQEYTQTYHRSWAQIEIALANAEFGFFFGSKSTIDVAISSPAELTKFDVGSDITITADASDSLGTITQVEFFQNDISLGIDTSSPYSFTWSNAPQGAYALTTIATNDSSATKESSAINITVGNAIPVVMMTADVTNGPAPLSVNFDASASTDADGDPLTYAWSFGDGNIATGATTSHIYAIAGTYTASVIVSDDSGDSSSASIIIEANDLPDCNFGVPLASGLPSINDEFNNVHVLGSGGPDLSNITKFNINWDSSNNGLYQLSINTNNGQPNWWVDLLGVTSHTLNAASPSLTISGSGITDLDGVYYASNDNGNFVLVSKSGGYTIYFSDSAVAPDCAPSNARVENTVAEGLLEELSISMYPNPASNHLSITSNHGLKGSLIHIFDLKGELKIALSIDYSMTTTLIDLSKLNTGMYILGYSTEKGEMKHFKLIKQ